MQNKENQSSKAGNETRRGLLKKGSVALIGAATIPAIGSARSRSQGKETPYQKALRLREQAGWSHEEWQNYLKNHGHETGSKEQVVNVSKKSSQTSGDVSTQKLDSHECTLTMTYTYPKYHSDFDIIQLEWEHDLDWNDTRERPNDNASISWDTDHYSPTQSVDDWVYYRDEYTFDADDVDSKTGAGAVCDWGDVAAGSMSYFGVRVEPNTNYDYTERDVFFDYVHTWSGAGITGISIDGSDGLSLQFASNTSMWDIEDSSTEKQLLDGETESG